MAVFAMGTMVANWQPSDTEATKLDKNADGQVQMKTLRTDDGKIILSWLRGERADGVFSYKLHLQIFDANGNAMFGDEGLIVCDKRTRTWTTDYALALAPNGDILLGYTDVRNDPNEENAESYLYRYNQQGQPVWDADGILFPAGKTISLPLSTTPSITWKRPPRTTGRPHPGSPTRRCPTRYRLMTALGYLLP